MTYQQPQSGGQQQYPQAQYGQPQYGQQLGAAQHAPAQYAPRPTRPKLGAPLARAARRAGGWSFTLLSAGWTLFSTALAIVLFASFFAWLFTLVVNRGGSADAGARDFVAWLETGQATVLAIPLVLSAAVGLGLMVLALFVSRRILARAGHPSPWGVTWAGTGIAIGVSWIVSWIPLLIAQLTGSVISTVAPAAALGDGDGGTLIGLGIAAVLGILLYLVLSLALSITLGCLSWWWMAHAMRPASPTGPVSPASPAAPDSGSRPAPDLP